VPEETIDFDETENLPVNKSSERTDDTSSSSTNNKKLRPDSLILRTNLNSVTTDPQPQSILHELDTKRKYLCRSQSTKHFDKSKKSKLKQLSNEIDQIYTLSSYSDSRDDDNYDSIEVIHERRVKNFSKFNCNTTSLIPNVSNEIPNVVPNNNSMLTIDIENPNRLPIEGNTLCNTSQETMDL
jgi:hypothetical protein